MQNHPSVTEYPKVRGMVHDVFFWNHNHPEGGKDETASKQKRVEAAMAARLAFDVTQQGYKDIALITPYVGQLSLIRAEVGKYMQFVVSDRDSEELAGLQVLLCHSCIMVMPMQGYMCYGSPKRPICRHAFGCILGLGCHSSCLQYESYHC